MSAFRLCILFLIGFFFKLDAHATTQEDEMKILKSQISSAFNVKNYKKASTLLTKLISFCFLSGK